MELLNLRLEIRLQLLLLRLVGRVLHFVVDALELLDTFGDLLQCSVDFRYEGLTVVSGREVERGRDTRRTL